MKRDGNTIYNLLLSNGEMATFDKVVNYVDGTPMTDDKLIGEYYIKIGLEYFKLNHSGFANVKRFGAKGDGVTDDYQAIQRAVYLAARLGFKVFCPYGIYCVSQEIQIPFFNGSLSVEISGEKSESSYDKQGVNPAPFSTVIKAISAMNTVFRARNGMTDELSFYTKINNLLIDGNGLAQHGYINGGQDVIEDLTIFNCASSGIMLETFTNSSIFNRVTCVANAGYGAELNGEWSTVSIFNQCKFRGNTLGGMFMVKSIASHLTDCIFENNAGAGLKMYAVGDSGPSQILNIMLSKCYFEQNNTTGGGGYQIEISGDAGKLARNIIFDQPHILSGTNGRLGVKIVKGDNIKFLTPLFSGENLVIPGWFNLGSETSNIEISGLTDGYLDQTTMTLDGAGIDNLIIKGFRTIDGIGTYVNNILGANICKKQINIASSRALALKEVAGTIITNIGQNANVYLDIPDAKPGFSFILVINEVLGAYFFALRTSGDDILYNGTFIAEVVQSPITLGKAIRFTSIGNKWLSEPISGVWV